MGILWSLLTFILLRGVGIPPTSYGLWSCSTAMDAYGAPMIQQFFMVRPKVGQQLAILPAYIYILIYIYIHIYIYILENIIYTYIYMLYMYVWILMYNYPKTQYQTVAYFSTTNLGHHRPWAWKRWCCPATCPTARTSTGSPTVTRPNGCMKPWNTLNGVY